MSLLRHYGIDYRSHTLNRFDIALKKQAPLFDETVLDETFWDKVEEFARTPTRLEPVPPQPVREPPRWFSAAHMPPWGICNSLRQAYNVQLDVSTFIDHLSRRSAGHAFHETMTYEFKIDVAREYFLIGRVHIQGDGKSAMA